MNSKRPALNASAVMRLVTTCTMVLLGFSTARSAPEAPKNNSLSDTPTEFVVHQSRTVGVVTVAGKRIEYDAVAGNLVVHDKNWDDTPQNTEHDAKQVPPSASMFYVAYFARNERRAPRPITFLYNGGPGSATIWLHMGAFGPKRVVTANDTHSPAAPYRLVNNDYSLLDASDLVFVDAPGAGLSRIAGKAADKAFYGVDEDAHAFAEFIRAFLDQYSRWNSPKYLFGESYGTARSAVLANLLQNRFAIDMNGVILLSQLLLFDARPDEPQFNPGIDLPYQLALPTYAATAWYHHKLPGPPTELPALLTEVKQFAMRDYAEALQMGGALSADRRRAIAEQMHQYTGLPAEYILKANLRINGGMFRKLLMGDDDLTAGRLDTRFSGATIDPLAKEADYDPFMASVRSAYVSLFSDYVRTDLQYAPSWPFKLSADIKTWNLAHQPPGADEPLQQSTNVLPDLAMAMKSNPHLEIQINAGYFDLATPFYQAEYEIRHLAIPEKLRSNVEFQFYPSGHMIYVSEREARALHDNVTRFILRTSRSLDQQ